MYPVIRKTNCVYAKAPAHRKLTKKQEKSKKAMPKRLRLYGLYYFYMCQCGANSQKIQTPKLKKFNEPGAVAQNHNARERQAPEDGPNKSMSSRSTTLVLVISLSEFVRTI